LDPDLVVNFPDPDPDPAKRSGSDRIRIRIRNTGGKYNHCALRRHFW
jgi:hypothetical protein